MSIPSIAPPATPMSISSRIVLAAKATTKALPCKVSPAQRQGAVLGLTLVGTGVSMAMIAGQAKSHASNAASQGGRLATNSLVSMSPVINNDNLRDASLLAVILGERVVLYPLMSFGSRKIMLPLDSGFVAKAAANNIRMSSIIQKAYGGFGMTVGPLMVRRMIQTKGADRSEQSHNTPMERMWIGLQTSVLENAIANAPRNIATKQMKSPELSVSTIIKLAFANQPVRSALNSLFLSGIVPNILTSATYNCVFFVVRPIVASALRDVAQHHGVDLDDHKHMSVAANTTVSGYIASATAYPFNVVRTALQGGTYDELRTSFVSYVKNMNYTSAFQTLYRGFLPNSLRLVASMNVLYVAKNYFDEKFPKSK